MERKKNEGSGNCEERKFADCRTKQHGYSCYVGLLLRSSPFFSGKSDL